MKKISTLVIMTFFCCLGALAQVELGNIKFSLGEGKKISPTTGKILVTFPDVKGVDPTTTSFEIAGKFTPGEELEFDGVTALFSEGYEISLSDYELEPKTDYTLTITSVKVNNIELLNDTTFVLHFQTRSAERKMSWVFTIDEASSAQIVAEATANPAGDGEDVTKYMDIQKNGSSTKRYYVPAKNYEEITLPDGSLLPMTEDLLFKFGNKSFYVGKYNDGDYKNRICFNNNNQMLVIPDCKVGDIITFSALRSSKSNTYMQAMNGCAIAPDGKVSSVTGLQDSIPMSSSLANHKFEVLVDGDVTFKIGNTLMTAITIEEGQPKVPRNYSVVAQYKEDGSDAIVLKELVAKTEATTGSTIKANYPYWLVDAEGNAYTHGSKGNEFVEAFDLKYGEVEVDTIFVINYAKTAYTGVAYLSEGEDIEGSIPCTHANAAVRSSMGKAAYVMEDTKLVTLQPGTYKIRAILFDAGTTPGYVCVFSKGATENDEISLTASATNWTEAESDLLTITEATDIKLLSGGSDKTGLDVVMIYKSDDAPEDPQGITEVNAGAQKMAARKLMKEGKILIQTEAGTVNVAGQLVK